MEWSLDDIEAMTYFMIWFFKVRGTCQVHNIGQSLKTEMALMDSKLMVTNLILVHWPLVCLVNDNASGACCIMAPDSFAFYLCRCHCILHSTLANGLNWICIWRWHNWSCFAKKVTFVEANNHDKWHLCSTVHNILQSLLESRNPSCAMTYFIRFMLYHGPR